MQTLYEILEVSPRASTEVIRAAYKSLVMQYHPDRNQDNPRADEILKAINYAYEILSDPIKRQAYDLKMADNVRQPGGSANTEHDSKTKQEEKRAEQPKPQPQRPSSKNVNADISESGPPIGVIFGIFAAAFIVFMLYILGHDTSHATVSSPAADNIASSTSSSTPVTAAIDNVSNTPENATPGQQEVSIPQSNQPSVSLTALPLPETGIIGQEDGTETTGQRAPLRITTPTGGDNYFVKLEDWNTNNTIMTLFIRAGEVADLEVPLGSYRMKYATGKTWYGPDSKFGPETQYHLANAQMDFEIEGDHVRGHEVQLIKQLNGNLHTSSISPAEF